ncbi:hypothetical protein KQI84_08895 [bacterium]|nr:hypothetical protein [bacterium]
MAEPAALEVMERYALLGPDFLTWLAVRIINDNVPAPPSEPGLSIDIQGPLVLGSSMGEATKITLAGDEAAAAPEVRAALREGKRLYRAKLSFTAQDATWTFTLDAESFDLKSVKVPVPKLPDLDEYMHQRIQALQHLNVLLLELFEIYLPIRLQPEQWREEVTGWRELD